jgi:hypothetical protein
MKDAEADRPQIAGRPPLRGKENDRCTLRFRRGIGVGMYRTDAKRNKGSLDGEGV